MTKTFLAGVAMLGALACVSPALADDLPAVTATAPVPTSALPPPPPPAPSVGGGMDLFSRDTVSVLLDWRLAVANGATSFVNGGFRKTRFQGNGRGGFSTIFAPVEADVV